MAHIFQPKLLNGHYGDPVVHLSLFGKNYSYLIDLGDISKMTNKEVLSLKGIFISHTHMDHFYGFDRVVRTFLGKNKVLKIFGPKNIIKNVNGKLQGYTWNLVDNYKTDFIVEVFEIYNQKIRRAKFRCKKKFKKEELKDITIKNSVIYSEEDHTVKGVVLDHQTPCISYIFEERFHINILKSKLEELGLETGKWLTVLKNYIYANELEKIIIAGDKKISVGELKDSVTKITCGYKIAYITDIQFSKKNIIKLKDFLKNTTFLFVEAPFLNKEKSRAKERYHLTAKQAGYIAKISNAKKVIPFHVSPIHTGEFHLIKKEITEMQFQ